MSRTYLQPGSTIDAIAGVGGVKSGDAVILGSLFGVAEVDALEGESYALTLTGVHLLPKATGAGINQGAKVYWVVANKECTATVGSNVLIGSCVETAGSSDTTVKVRLNGTTT
jgi:predicted RecA/RadA family phage recombinase